MNGLLPALCLAVASRVAVAQYVVQSDDAKIAVTISVAGGVESVKLGNGEQVEVPLSGATTVSECVVVGAPTVQKTEGAVSASKVMCLRSEPSNCVNVTEVWTATKGEVQWDVHVTGNSVGLPWSSLLNTQVDFNDASNLKLWMPWNTGSGATWADPLLPSDGGYSWSNASYALGAVYANMPSVIAEHATFITGGQSFSLIANPSNLPHHGTVNTTGPGGASCKTPAACRGPASVAIYHRSMKFSASLTHVLRMTLVPHATASLRDSLRWSVETYPEYWKPTPNSNSKSRIEGMGSYSWYNGNITDPFYDALGYKSNWDLGGRFFPYMGMFLPPVKGQDTQWENDPEGRQDHYNVSYSMINKLYTQQRDAGHTPLCYFNIFEFGRNVVYDAGNDKPSGHGDWHDASSYLAGFLRDSLVTDYTCAYGVYCKTTQTKGNPYTWQNGTVMDPLHSSYNTFLMDQVNRKLENTPTFEGLAIDRSDWIQLYSHDRDDGFSWASDRPSANYALAWLGMAEMLRGKLPDRVLTINTFGFAWLPLMKHMDGSYSEGTFVNAAGLLGVASTAVLWTYSSDECCKTPEVATQYFQQSLYMRVFPYAPFPKADHSLPRGSVQDTYYLHYGAMFKAIRGYEWVLDSYPMKVTVAAGSTLKHNSFTNGTSFIGALMLGGALTTAEVELPTEYKGWEYLHTGSNSTWKPLVGTTVPLADGCALVRGSKI